MKIHILLKELEVLAIGWEKYGLNHTFSGYTLEQIKALIASLKELMAAMDAPQAGVSRQDRRAPVHGAGAAGYSFARCPLYPWA